MPTPFSSIDSIDSANAPSRKVARTFRTAFNRKLVATWAGLNTAMLFDTYSTFSVQRRCSSCVEANPVAAPFVTRGPRVAYPAGEVFDAGVMLLAAKVRTTQHLHRIWWMIPVGLAAGHAIAYQHNMRLTGD